MPEIFQEHRRQPTMDEWLDGLDCLKPVALSTSTAESVRQSREADEADLVDAWPTGPTGIANAFVAPKVRGSR